ncbi:MAG: glycosyltransferase family 2 protein [Deltaproteobacteria bacterium]|jgi:hypothetical protein|nr:glycosyltransferase family 2 protein [Deltaproteobacteria bacterium]
MSDSAIQNESKIVVIVVNYNGFDDTVACLESLQLTGYDNFQIIVVDNASKINPLLELMRRFPDVIYLRSEKNLGFTGGNNLGLKKAYALKPKYIFLLNNDTVVSKNILSELYSFMENNPKMGLIGPLNYYFDKKNIIAFSGANLNRNNGMMTFLYSDKKLSDIKERIISCSFIIGAAMFIRADLIEQIGGLYNDYFLTSEESELCIKVADLGYQLAVITSCCIWHKVSMTMGSESEISNYYIFRNKLWFIKRNAIKITLKDIFQLAKYIVICLLSFLIKKRKFSAAKGILAGIYDFFMGVKGPGRFKNRLNA